MNPKYAYTETRVRRNGADLIYSLDDDQLAVGMFPECQVLSLGDKKDELVRIIH